MPDGERRLAAIMFTDMLGYTALSQKSESLALKLLDEQRGILRPFFPKHNGREVKTIGDAFLVEFASALEAVRCAFDVQESLHELNEDRPLDERILVRIGVHLGDVVHGGEDVYGDAVNMASRIEALAAPGGICVTQQVYDQVRNKFEFPLISLGKRELKNVQGGVEVYRVALPWETTQSPVADLDEKRIAVLPLKNMSPDPNDDYFADGMTEELISTLSKIGQLTVLARTSVMQYRNTTKRISDIARELNTGTLIEGSVRKAANKVRITVQLLDAKTEGHLWTENYDRDLDDIFQIQSDVAKQVSEALKVRILPAEKAKLARVPTTNTTAYTLYLRGRYHWNRRGLDDIRRAANYFEQAIAEDPKFAPGYAGLADCHELIAVNWQVDVKENQEKARAAVTRALELDPDLAEAHATKGLVLSDDYDLNGAKEEFRRAIELEPSYATAHQWYAQILFDELDIKGALSEIKMAVNLDPLSQVISMNLGGYYLAMKDYATALDILKKAAEINPGFGPGHFQLASVYGKMKMFDDARREAEIGVEAMRPYYPKIGTAMEMWLAYLRDDKAEVKRNLGAVEETPDAAGVTCTELAYCHFFLGEKDAGFEWLEKAYSRREPSLLSFQHEEAMDSVRSDPRYLEMLSRLGLSKG